MKRPDYPETGTIVFLIAFGYGQVREGLFTHLAWPWIAAIAAIDIAVAALTWWSFRFLTRRFEGLSLSTVLAAINLCPLALFVVTGRFSAMDSVFWFLFVVLPLLWSTWVLGAVDLFRPRCRWSAVAALLMSAQVVLFYNGRSLDGP